MHCETSLISPHENALMPTMDLIVKIHGKTIRRFGKLSSIIALILAANNATAAEDTSGDLIDRAKKAFSSGQKDEAMVLATKAIEAEPKNPRGYFLRARLYEERSEPAKALSDYDQ